MKGGENKLRRVKFSDVRKKGRFPRRFGGLQMVGFGRHSGKKMGEADGLLQSYFGIQSEFKMIKSNSHIQEIRKF